ncbi:MAG TPA: hypothetical protein VHX39_31820 [Acetobacteraceae bacterium]|nr:hypothetical protein [Acetobacteraceae bacterium]
MSGQDRCRTERLANGEHGAKQTKRYHRPRRTAACSLFAPDPGTGGNLGFIDIRHAAGV